MLRLPREGFRLSVNEHNGSIDALIESLNDPFPEVRWHAAGSLGLLHPPEALEALITAATDGVYGPANTSAIAALAAYRDERSAQLLLKILETGDDGSGVAGYALAKRRDARAIKPMLDSLLSKAGGPRKTWHILTEFEASGYDLLEPLMAHADVEIRERAERCVGNLAFLAKDRTIRRKAFELLQRCVETETNEELRHRIGISIKISAKKNLNAR